MILFKKAHFGSNACVLSNLLVMQNLQFIYVDLSVASAEFLMSAIKTNCVHLALGPLGIFVDSDIFALYFNIKY